MDREELTQALRSEAERLGFQLCGVTPAIEPPGLGRFHEWLDAGYAGEMKYLDERRAAYAHPRGVLDGAQSVVMLAMCYSPSREATNPESESTTGRIARYALGTRDYHDVIHERLKQLVTCVKRWQPTAHARGVVDTAPLAEREFAQLAGLGWVGKNTLLLNRQLGSYFFLAALLVDVPLQYDAPHVADHCGSCRACLDACPTDAFPEAYVLDAQRCISYLTIELREPIPIELREGMGNWIFGCDICQEVCPWNRHAPRPNEPDFVPRGDLASCDAAELFALDEAAFRERFRRTPLWRSKRRGVLRNAAIALGNQRAASALPVLERGLSDEEPLVRGACAWAIGQIGAPGSAGILSDRRKSETDPAVLEEIRQAQELLQA